MPTGLLIGSLIMLAVGLVLLVGGIATIIKAPQMGAGIRLCAMLMFVPAVLFCPWGFAAAMEPGDYHILWRIGYVLVFLSSLAAIGRLVFSKREQQNLGHN